MAQRDNSSFAQFTIKLTGNANDLSDIVSDLGTEYYIDKSDGEATAKKEIQIQKESLKFAPLKRKLKMTEEILPKRVILVVPKDSPVPATITSNHDVTNDAHPEADTTPKEENDVENQQLLQITENETSPSKKTLPQKVFKLANTKNAVIPNKKNIISVKINQLMLPAAKTSPTNILFKTLMKAKKNSAVEDNKSDEPLNITNNGDKESSEPLKITNNDVKKSDEPLKIKNHDDKESDEPLKIKNNDDKKSDDPLKIKSNDEEFVDANNDNHDQAGEPLNLELMQNLGLTYCKNGIDSAKPTSNKDSKTLTERNIISSLKPNTKSPLISPTTKTAGTTAVKVPDHVKRKKKRKMLTRKAKKSATAAQRANSKKKRGRPKKVVPTIFETLNQRSQAIRETLSQEIGIPILEEFTQDHHSINQITIKTSTPLNKVISTPQVLNTQNFPPNDDSFTEAVRSTRSSDYNRRKSLRLLRRSKLVTKSALSTDETKEMIFSSTSEKPILLQTVKKDRDRDHKEQEKSSRACAQEKNDVPTVDINESPPLQPQIQQYIISHSPNSSTQSVHSNISFIKILTPTLNVISPMKNSNRFDQSNPVFFKGLKVRKSENTFMSNGVDCVVAQNKKMIIKNSPTKTENPASPNIPKGCETPRGSLSSASSAKSDVTIQASPKSDASLSKSSKIKIINGVKCSLRAPDPKLLNDEVLKDKIQSLLKKTHPKSSSIARKLKIISEPISEISESLVSTTTTESNQISKKDCYLCDKLRLEVNELWNIIKNLKKQLHDYQDEYENAVIKASNKKSLWDELQVSGKVIRQLEERNRLLGDEVRNEKLSTAKLRINLAHRDNQVQDLKARLSKVTKIFTEVEDNVRHVKQQLEVTEPKNMVSFKKNVQEDVIRHT